MICGRSPEASEDTRLLTLYGIKNCDTVKKARNWLKAQDIEYRFHDLREDGLERDQAAGWIAELGWETLVNRRSTTWKQLPASMREVMDADLALTQVIEHPTLIKRPVLDTGDSRHVGFKEDEYRNILNLHTL
jgi:Spx/MgsR family transcriptional regulator